MSEHTLYIRRTKGGHVMPPITLDEMLGLVASRGVDEGDDLRVVGVRSFPSDETWAPMRDYPEFSRFFTSGRELAKVEAHKAKQSWGYAMGAFLCCLIAIFFFWWKPYVDAEDAVGEVGRLNKQLKAERSQATLTENNLKERAEKVIRLSDALEKKNQSLRNDLALLREKLEEAQRVSADYLASESLLAGNDKKLRAEVDSLKSRIAKFNELPKFWPGAESMQVPGSEEEVRLISVLPDNGYLYVIGLRSFPNDSVVLLDQPGFFGTRIFATVVNSYPHAGGGRGMSLHVPDSQAEDVAKIRKLKLGESIKCSAVHTPK